MDGSIRKFEANRFSRLLGMCAGAVIVFAIAETFTASRIAHAQVHVVPFTLRMENRMVTDTGGKIIDVRTKAVRSDGAMVEMGHIFGKVGFAAGENERRISLPTGEVLTVHDSLNTVTSWNTGSSEAVTKRRAARQRVMLSPPLIGCVGKQEKSLSKETIMGQETVEVLWPYNGGEHRVTEWRALNLNCQPIQARIENKQPDGSFKLNNEIYPVSLVLGEPDPSLFRVPSDYAEMKPSNFLHTEADRLGMPADKRTELEKEAQSQDVDYAKYH